MIIGRNSRFIRIPSTLLSLRLALLLLMIDLILGIAMFMLIEKYDLADAIYMAIITISTVGYTEVKPLSEIGKLFTSAYILINIAIFAYLLAVFSYYVIQGEIFKGMHKNLVKSRIDKLDRHIIICGYGKYGKEIAHHFFVHKVPFVVIDIDPEEIELIQQSSDDILYIFDDATHDEALIGAGIERAQGLISALPDDAENVFTVLTARQINSKINIISRAKDPKSQRKLLLAGANHVVMPEQIGGFYMATLISKPGAVEFFSFLTNEYQADIGFEEIKFEDLPLSLRGKPISDLSIRQKTGANIISFKNPEGHYEINPGPDVILIPESSFIIIGDHDQLESLNQYIDSYKRMV
ncbi:MAG: NAD-binding protein [Bacteroidota bacterium]